MMTNRRHLLALPLLLALGAAPAAAQNFPTGPIRVTSIFPAGAGPDAAMRVVADKLPALLGQSVVIEPKPGASGLIAAGAVKAAAPTGHELLLADVGTLATNMSLFKRLPYDTERDFVPVALLYRTSFIMAVAANSPYRTLPELLAAAQATPDKVSYMTNGAGTPLHLGAVQIEAATGVHMLHVPFKDVAQGFTAVASGDVTWVPTTLGSAGPLIKAGKLRFLAVMDSKRMAAAPEVPTMAEAGGPKGVEAVTWVALMAPRGTPAASVEALNKAVNTVLGQPDVMERLNAFGFVPAPSTQAQLADVIRADIRRNAELVKRTGATLD
jgi:tripartite-type tricarboxylate transporter receptor subunit TctC